MIKMMKMMIQRYKAIINFKLNTTYLKYILSLHKDGFFKNLTAFFLTLKPTSTFFIETKEKYISKHNSNTPHGI